MIIDLKRLNQLLEIDPISCLATAQAAPKETFKIRYAYIPNANTGLLTIAQDKGVFKDLGLDMEMIRFNSGPAQFAAQAGVGFLIMDASILFRIPYVYIGIAIIGLIGLLLEILTVKLEGRILHWVKQ